MAKNDIHLEYDKITGNYYIFWKPSIVVAGKTVTKAFEDLRKTTCFCINTIIESKLNEIDVGKEN